MCGAYRELEPSSPEPDHKGRPGQLLGRPKRFALTLDLRDNDLSGQTPEAELARIIDEGHTLPVSPGTLGYVGQDVPPPASQVAHQLVQRAKVLPDFLDSHQIEAADDLGDVVEGLLATSPVAGRVEFADVPGGQQQGVRSAAVRNFGLRKTFLEPQEPLGRPPPASHFAVDPVVVGHDFPSIISAASLCSLIKYQKAMNPG